MKVGGEQASLMSLKEVVAQTGIPAATIRYYDQQFEEYLGITRGAGRRRMFDPASLKRLTELRRLLKDEGLSIRQARKLLTDDGDGVSAAGQIEALRVEVDSLKAKVRSLEEQVNRLKDIQSRTLALVDGLTNR
ncbi:MAG: MerR family transcriptional regulator [Desulfarculaceae bacterium]|nr:MerR family transcriptional regulator [Desulfarculaceae bacterium]